MMKIISRKARMHLSRQKFLDLCVLVFVQGRFVSEDVDAVRDILAGEAIYDAGVQGRMVPHSDAVPRVSEEILRGIESAMSYFCDRYGPVKGFILGELFFRKQGDPAELLEYADNLERLFTRIGRVRAAFYRWFVDDLLKRRVHGS